MNLQVKTCVLCVALLVGAADFANAQGFFDKLKKAAQGKDYVVRGRLQVQSGEWLTCFDGIKTGYLGPSDLARPADTKVDPATGKVQATTSAIPSIITTRSGVVTANDCDSLADQHLLVLVMPGASNTARSADTGYSDPYGCTKPEWTKDEVVKYRREIMDCQAEAITERAAAREQAKRGAASGGSASAPAQPSAANAKLQQETAEKFKAIQGQGAAPVAAQAQSAEDLAWDGAKLCGLKPAYMLKLKDEALNFVRYDAKQGAVILSEMAGGARRDLKLSANDFAQRASFNAQAIGQGGDTCGRAFWNAEAYKAASAAMSGS